MELPDAEKDDVEPFGGFVFLHVAFPKGNPFGFEFGGAAEAVAKLLD